MNGKKVRVVIDVEIRDCDVHEGTYYCATTGDSYASFAEYLAHQIGRDLQCLKLDAVVSYVHDPAQHDSDPDPAAPE